MNAFYQSLSFPDGDLLYMQHLSRTNGPKASRQASSLVDCASNDGELRYICTTCFQETDGEYFYRLIEESLRQLQRINIARNPNRSNKTDSGALQYVEQLRQAIATLKEVLSDSNTAVAELEAIQTRTA